MDQEGLRTGRNALGVAMDMVETAEDVLLGATGKNRVANVWRWFVRTFLGAQWLTMDLLAERYARFMKKFFALVVVCTVVSLILDGLGKPQEWIWIAAALILAGHLFGMPSELLKDEYSADAVRSGLAEAGYIRTKSLAFAEDVSKCLDLMEERQRARLSLINWALGIAWSITVYFVAKDFERAIAAGGAANVGNWLLWCAPIAAAAFLTSMYSWAVARIFLLARAVILAVKDEMRVREAQ